MSVDELSMDTLIGPCRVFDFSENIESIGYETLKNLDFAGVTRVLFKTRNSIWCASGETEFQKDYVCITESAAKFLVDHGVNLVGIDYLSVEKFGSSDYSTHHLLLRNQVVIIEGLNLSGISSGEYELIALPLRLKGSDGSPARVILKEQ